MIEQLLKKNCKTGEYSEISPAVSLDSVFDSDGTVLRDILNKTNHLFLPFKNNSKRDTRLQIPSEIRRRGLWISYISCAGNLITEIYDGSGIDDKSWSDGNNWKSYFDEKLVSSIVYKVLSWYKA